MAGEARQTVGDYVTLQRGNTYSGALVGKPGPALLGLGSIEPGGGFRAGKYKTFGGECAPKIMLATGDVYVALKGATKDGSMVGSVARVPPDIPAGRLTQDTARFDFIDGRREVADHVYWVLRTPQYRQYCASRLTGSAAASFSRNDLLSYPIPPITANTRSVVRLLEAIEAKIELNRRTNEALEAIARALFKSWFVDFDPVRAKSEGRDPGLPSHLADLFPSSFEDSELGEIPTGWRVAPIGELATIVGGATPSTKEATFWEDGGNYWATPKDLSALATPVLLETGRRITEAGLAQIGSGLLPPGTVLLSSRAPIGYLAIAEVPLAINQGFIAMRPAPGVSNLFLLYWAESAHEEIVSRANGSTFLEISKANFRPIPAVAPTERIFELFDQIVRPVYSRIVVNERKTRTLIRLRDVLLPKLVSGEVRVQAEEHLLAEAPR